MDNLLRQLERRAKEQGRESPEDQQLLSAKLRTGDLSIAMLEAAASLGDLSSYKVLLSRSLRKGHQITPAILEHPSRFIEIIDEIIHGWNIPLGISIMWISDCIKIVINLCKNATTGRKNKDGKFTPLFVEQETLNVFNEILDILQEIEYWQKTPTASLENIIKKAQVFCAKTEALPMGVGVRIIALLSDATCQLVQAIICGQYPCAAPDETSQIPLVVQGESYGELQDSEEYIINAITYIEWAYESLIPSVVPGIKRGKTPKTVINHHLYVFRKMHLQLYADIILGRSWNRPA